MNYISGNHMAFSNNGKAEFNRQMVLKQPDGYGTNTGDCGDTVEMFIAQKENRIHEVFYQTDGCAATHLCAAAVGQLIKGQKIDAAWQIRPKHIIAFVSDLPADHHHCAELAAGALYRALTDLQNNLRKPWAKYYRTVREQVS